LDARRAVIERVVGWRALASAPEQEIVDALGVGLHVAREPTEHLADGGASLVRRVLEEHVIGVSDLDEVMGASTRPTLLVATADRLHEHAGGVGRDAERGRARLVAHRLDDGRAERQSDLLEPATHRAAIDRSAHAREAIFLAIERNAIAELV